MDWSNRNPLVRGLTSLDLWGGRGFHIQLSLGGYKGSVGEVHRTPGNEEVIAQLKKYAPKGNDALPLFGGWLNGDLFSPHLQITPDELHLATRATWVIDPSRAANKLHIQFLAHLFHN